MDFSIEGKLASIDVPRKKALQPLYEAVVNAFQAIEDAQRPGRGRIQITVLRDERLDGLAGVGRICGFTIVDDGVGFTEPNLQSFFTAYSLNKLKRGGKGIGRFTFLKVFDRIEIDSHFVVGEKMVSRRFGLPQTHHKPTEPPTASLATSGRTSVELTAMKEPWRSECEVGLDQIALGLIAHCIPYFLHPQCPRVELSDADHRIGLNEFFETNFQKAAQARTFTVDGHDFKLTGFRLWNNRAESTHRLLYAANYRAVVSETLAKELPSIGDHHLSGEDGKKFVYLGFVESDYLNRHTNPERLRFTFPSGAEEDGPSLSGLPSLADIRRQAVSAVREDLAPFLEDAALAAETKVRRFVSRNPELKPMLRYLPKFIREIPPDATDLRIHDVLQRHRFVTEKELRKEGRELLKNVTKPAGRPEDYEARVNNYLERSNELGKSALARYITHRRVILEFLEKSLEVDPTTAKYPLESVLHEIIYPMNAESSEVPYENQNLWIIDEKLAFHEYLASDKQLRTSTALDSASLSRPDLMIFDEAVSFGPEPDNLTSLVVVEFKRPDRDDFAKESPIAQAHRMIREIRQGKAKRLKGRKISVISADIPAYAYIVCDLSEELVILAQDAGLRKTADQLGYANYFPETHTYIEIIPYNKLVGDAKKRNKQLFDKLFLP